MLWWRLFSRHISIGKTLNSEPTLIKNNSLPIFVFQSCYRCHLSGTCLTRRYCCRLCQVTKALRAQLKELTDDETNYRVLTIKSWNWHICKNFLWTLKLLLESLLKYNTIWLLWQFGLKNRRKPMRWLRWLKWLRWLFKGMTRWLIDW